VYFPDSNVYNIFKNTSYVVRLLQNIKKENDNKSTRKGFFVSQEQILILSNSMTAVPLKLQHLNFELSH